MPIILKMENKDESSIEAVYLRLKAYLNKLEEIIGEIVEELEYNRKERNDWFLWHEDWKSAWLGAGRDLSVGKEFENLRFLTSVKRRNSLFDLKKEVAELKVELEAIRSDREKLLLFLHRDVFQY